MMLTLVLIIIMVILIIYPYVLPIIKNQTEEELEGNKNNLIKNEDLSKYVTNNYVMTPTELKFYRELKKVTDKLDLSIFPQVNMERIINVYNNNSRDRNRIKSRSIDFTIVNNKNCRIVCCIELDDYTHNRAKVIKADEFKNRVFEKVKIPLHRIKVNSYYNITELEHLIVQDLPNKTESTPELTQKTSMWNDRKIVKIQKLVLSGFFMLLENHSNIIMTVNIFYVKYSWSNYCRHFYFCIHLTK